MMATTRAQRRQLERDNAKLPLVLQFVPPERWPLKLEGSGKVAEAWRSRDYLVIVYNDHPGIQRLSVCRTIVGTSLNGEDRWLDGIAWDELQRIKRETGRGHLDAVEVYPADRDIVNVANMRHLWVITDCSSRLNFIWRAR